MPIVGQATQRKDVSTDLHEVDWDAVHATDFRSTDVKEGKQAEFLVHESFPFDLVEQIGVLSNAPPALEGGRLA